ncbi:hypothetical protein [Flammeovirga kamogawensis]|uniref:Lipoprotein n=1 Tax=Flammeovirga kamogawensis TaxID=373891 RepID=A0ABX8GQ07_9BACT|nr:hypothetical protein [Flammeovirga kamogawensis]MBB6463033.1 hypothetical protein [Flammeovirga kamogawensis]QWG05670.1 hypothetical protein KM029_09770 [Flammeovirga kamogawensis]TRX67500.1 hypothetical protein EO216_04805 [Flammeovirga kamogawensis]
MKTLIPALSIILLLCIHSCNIIEESNLNPIKETTANELQVTTFNSSPLSEPPVMEYTTRFQNKIKATDDFNNIKVSYVSQLEGAPYLLLPNFVENLRVYVRYRNGSESTYAPGRNGWFDESTLICDLLVENSSDSIVRVDIVFDLWNLDWYYNCLCFLDPIFDDSTAPTLKESNVRLTLKNID